jgi:uncharacterized protein YeaO (DUF488 family)
VDIRLKRAYEPAVPEDGYRVLIDRLWPRGITRERAELDEWERELPPSTELRQWFGHEPSRFVEFRRRYIEELRDKRPAIARLRRQADPRLFRARRRTQRRRRARGGPSARSAKFGTPR